MRIKDVIKWIEEDIENQEKLLTGDFKRDKPIKWRIIGMESLKEKIISKLKGGQK